MSDYTSYSPANLTNIDTSIPTSSEDANQLWQAIQQTRKILAEVLQKEHNDDGTHKNVQVPDGSITGPKIQSSSSDDSLRAVGTDHIKNKAVTKEKIADFGITGKMIGDGEVDTRAIKDLAIAENKLGSKVVSRSKLGDKAVTDDALGDKAVSTRALADFAVGSDQIKSKAVTPDKLSLLEALVVLGTSSGTGIACEVGGQMEVDSIDISQNPPIANFKVRAGEGTLVPVAIFREIGSDGGTPIASTWNVRPLSTTSQLNVKFDPTEMVQGGPKTFRFREKGTYLIFIAAAAYKAQLHQIRIRNVTRDQTILAGILTDADASTAGQVPSVAFGVASIRDDGDEFQFQHWVQAGSPNARLGIASVSNGEAQTFMIAAFLKL